MAVFTLIDTKRQWFKAAVGMPVQEMDRASSFCTHTIESDSPFAVADALQDPHFAGNPYVLGAPHIRFYATVLGLTPLAIEIKQSCESVWHRAEGLEGLLNRQTIDVDRTNGAG
ncbi:MAG: hypothetical protein ACFCU9_16250 [Cyanophyceae cyanobacterium]